MEGAGLRGSRRGVTKLAAGDAYHVGPQFLPDGHDFIYVRLSKTAVQGVYVGSIDAKPEEQDSTRVVNADSVRYAEAPHGGGGYLVYLREQSLMAQRFDVEARKLTERPIAIAEFDWPLCRPRILFGFRRMEYWLTGRVRLKHNGQARAVVSTYG